MIHLTTDKSESRNTIDQSLLWDKIMTHKIANKCISIQEGGRSKDRCSPLIEIDMGTMRSLHNTLKFLYSNNCSDYDKLGKIESNEIDEDSAGF
jgi:hypothetical protein